MDERLNREPVTAERSPDDDWMWAPNPPDAGQDRNDAESEDAGWTPYRQHLYKPAYPIVRATRRSMRGHADAPHPRPSSR